MHGGAKLYPGGAKLYPGGAKLYPGGAKLYPGGAKLYPFEVWLLRMAHACIRISITVRMDPLTKLIGQ